MLHSKFFFNSFKTFAKHEDQSTILRIFSIGIKALITQAAYVIHTVLERKTAIVLSKVKLNLCLQDMDFSDIFF